MESSHIRKSVTLLALSYKLYQGGISPNIISGVMNFILTEEFSVLMNNICTH